MRPKRLRQRVRISVDRDFEGWAACFRDGAMTPITRFPQLNQILRNGVHGTAPGGAIKQAGVATRLAQRVAHQLVFKFDAAELGGPATWNAIGRVLRLEAEQLTDRLGLVDRQIVLTLPKLAPDDVERFFEELRAADPRVARTILNSALNAADPRSAGRRDLREYHRVIEQLNSIDPGIARTVATSHIHGAAP